MSISLQKFGSLQESKFALAHLISYHSQKQLKIFPIPGRNALMNNGFDLYQKGVKIVASPRHANVLMIVGTLTKELLKAAAITYAQIPRPRILVSVDTEEISPLPEPDLILSAKEINDLVFKLKNTDFWNIEQQAYKPSFLMNLLDDSDDKDEHGHDHNNVENQDHSQHDSGGGIHTNHSHPGGNNSEDESGEHDQQSNNKDKDNKDQHGHNHNHDNGGSGFMSMVKMTKDMPRAADGLPMDMNEGRFGPFHPGLQDALRIKMMLDGDTVKIASFEKGLLSRDLLHTFPDDPAKLPAHLEKLDPLQPLAYKNLAISALYNISGEGIFLANIAKLENERICYHLFQIATLMQTIGDHAMHYKVHQNIRDFQKGDFSSDVLFKTIRKLKKRPYLKQRLKRTGKIPEIFLHHLSGPVAKAAGKIDDCRSAKDNYQNFKPVQYYENNAWGQLLVRLDEISQSLEFINSGASEETSFDIDKINFSGDQSGNASIETATGTACLHLNLTNGKITGIKLEVPSTKIAALIPEITMQEELSDALVAIASLGISPWEIDK